MPGPPLTFDPGDLVISLPASDPLHDPRVEGIPVTRDDVLNAVVRPLPPIEVRRRGDQDLVIDGKQRTKAALVANAVGARVYYRGRVEAVKAAVGTLMEDLEFVARLRDMMSGRPIRLRAVATNSGDEAGARLQMQARNHVRHADQLADTIRWAQDQAERFGTTPADIALALGGEASGVTERKVRGWLKRDASSPRARKPRAFRKQPAKRIARAAESLRSEGDATLAVLLEWVQGKATDDDAVEFFPALRRALNAADGT